MVDFDISSIVWRCTFGKSLEWNVRENKGPKAPNKLAKKRSIETVNKNQRFVQTQSTNWGQRSEAFLVRKSSFVQQEGNSIKMHKTFL